MFSISLGEMVVIAIILILPIVFILLLSFFLTRKSQKSKSFDEGKPVDIEAGAQDEV